MYQRIHASDVVMLPCPVQQQDKDPILGLKDLAHFKIY